MFTSQLTAQLIAELKCMTHCALRVHIDAVLAKVSTILSVLQLVHFVAKIRPLAGAKKQVLCVYIGLISSLSACKAITMITAQSHH